VDEKSPPAEQNQAGRGGVLESEKRKDAQMMND